MPLSLASIFANGEALTLPSFELTAVAEDEGEALAGAAAVGQISTLDPFIKIAADSNRGIILMPVLSDVKLSLPPGSMESFANIPSFSTSPLPAKSSSSSTSGPPPTYQPAYSPLQPSQPSFSQSTTPVVNIEKQQSLSYPSFSTLSKKSSSTRSAPAQIDSSPSSKFELPLQNIQKQEVKSALPSPSLSPSSSYSNTSSGISISPEGNVLPSDIRRQNQYNIARAISGSQDIPAGSCSACARHAPASRQGRPSARRSPARSRGA